MGKYNYDLDVFYREDDISWYLLGAWMTDGNICVRSNRILPKLSSCDLDWLEMIRDLICPTLGLLRSRKTNCYHLPIYSTELGRWFISKGCTPNKSLTLQWPKVPEKYLPDFIRGCIDGDGSLGLYHYKRSGEGNRSDVEYDCVVRKIYLCGASKPFADRFMAILDGQQIAYYLDINEPSDQPIQALGNHRILQKNTCYRVTMTGANAKTFANWIYYPGHKISMARKQIIAQSIIDWNKVPVKGVPRLHGSKLSATDIPIIRLEVASGVPRKVVADRHKVHRVTIDDIINGKTWSHIK